MCLHDKGGSAIFEPVVGPVMYVRFHGPSGRYSGRYDLRRLEWWAGRLLGHHRSGRNVFAYFNNDPEGMAVFNASELKAMLARSDK
jgi:uncharacterized protein YecE (DUF72 family)